MDKDRNRHRQAGSGWQRPPVEERADQVRVWRETPVDELQNPALRTLAEAWERAALRERLRPPSREAFQPSEVVEVLGRVTVLERAPSPTRGHTWRYRLVGTEIVTIVQADVTGQPIERFHAPLAEMLRAQFDRAEAAACPVGFMVRTIVDQRAYAYEKLVLPVRSGPDADVDQIVVASFPIESP